MLTEGFIPWLAQGPFFWFAAIIGVVVSMDVAVVELTRDYEPEEKNGKRRIWTSRMQTMAFLHASFHSLSFLIYTTVIYVLQLGIFFPFDIFDLPSGLAAGLLALINFFVVSFIWWTYRSKIKEDHSEKSDDSDVIERRDMKLFVDLVRALSHKVNIGDRARGVAVAGSVAIDMLAVSALLKTFILPNGSTPPVASASGIVLLDVIIFAVIVFPVVGICVFLAQMIGKAARESHTLVVILRVAEPFAVFFILAGMARLMAELSFGELPGGFNQHSNTIDAIFAVFVVASLFWSNGVGLKRLSKVYAKRSVDTSSQNPPISFCEVAHDLKALAPFFGIMIVVFVLVFTSLLVAYETVPGGDTHNHLIEGTGYIAGIVLLFTIYALYWPSKKLDDWETNESANFRDMTHSKPLQFWNRLGGVALALAALNCYNFVVIGRTLETEAILLWSMYVILAWLLFDLRRWRFCLSDPVGTARRANDADYAELVTAIGLASSAVAILVSFFVRQLIS